MNIAKSLSSLSLAIAMVGGLVLLAPSSADAAGKSNKKDRIIRICYSGNNFCRDNNFKLVKPPSRGCKKGSRCTF